MEGDSSTDTATTGVNNLTINSLESAREDDFSYESMMAIDKPILPIDNHKDTLIDLMLSNRVLIIKGATGCGKSTQVPMYLLEALLYQQKKRKCNIVVTQPRRIAAVSIAERVCKERKWKLGDVVGYQIGLNKVAGPSTNLLFCTTGILLQRLVCDKTLGSIDCIILDEIHERDKDMDFLMIVIRELLKENLNTRLILMSATMDFLKLANYFGQRTSPDSDDITPARCYQVSNAMCFNVHKFFLQELRSVDEELYKKLPHLDLNKPQIVNDQFLFVKKIIQSFDKIEVTSMIKYKGAVLVFLPGINEITQFYQILNEHCKKEEKEKWLLLILHSTVPKEQQNLVFCTPPSDVRKIILSTKIAESSITVPDVKYVIDFCLTKMLTTKKSCNYSCLEVDWTSQSSCLQRAGRVGRVSEGRVYYMITREFYNKLPIDDAPEILRCPLGSLVLHAKMLKMGSPSYIFERALDPPDTTHLERTILSLKEMGALSRLHNSEYKTNNGVITYMGKILSVLPVDPLFGKLVFLGYIFNVLNECVIMAASMSVKNPFSVPYSERLKGFRSKMFWADYSYSDLFAYLKVYQMWQVKKSRGEFDKTNGSALERDWARRNLIEIMPLREIEKLVTEITVRLEKNEIRPNPSCLPNQHQKDILLKIVIGGAFYPNYFIRNKIDEKQALKTLGSNCLNSTVYLKGLPSEQLEFTQLYALQIKNQLSYEQPNNMKISTDGSSKVFVKFSSINEREDINVLNAVFTSVKARHVQPRLVIKGYRVHEAREKLKEVKSRIPARTNQDQCIVPNDKYIKIMISHIEDPSCFWVQNIDRLFELQNIENLLNTNRHNLTTLKCPPRVGNIYAALYDDGVTSEYYRAKVMNINSEQKKVKVLYLDYGNSQVLPFDKLVEFDSGLRKEDLTTRAACAFKCSLANVTLSAIKNSRGKWSTEAIQWLENNYLMKPPVMAEIYSIVEDVPRLIIYTGDSIKGTTVNQQLIDIGLALHADESYLSQMSHNYRSRNNDSTNWKDISDIGSYVRESDVPSMRDSVPFELYGPYTPLEAKISSLLQSTYFRAVHIDKESVNGVLLDTNPHDDYESLVVSAFVGTSPESGDLTIRNTTLMPSIPGLATFLCLLFAPQVELRLHEDHSRYTGALCGLGYQFNDKSGSYESLYPDNDLAITFDTLIKNPYISKINLIRYILNDMSVTKGEPDVVKETQVNLQNKLFQLLSHESEKMYNDYLEGDERFQWGQIPDSLLKNPAPGLIEQNHPSEIKYHAYPLIWGAELRAPRRAAPIDLEDTLNQLSEMNKIANGEASWKNSVWCELCGDHLEDHQKLSIHVLSSKHISNVAKIKSSHTS